MRKNLKENFYTRLKELSGVKSANNAPASLSTSTLVEYSRAGNGLALGIVKENHSYFIKTSNSKADKLGAEDFVYINGIENKYKYQYPSLAEAIKNRNFFVQSLNESANKKFKVVSLNENENINKAQVNADSLNAGKAQGEADKSKGSAPLKDTALEKEPGEVKSSKEIAVEKKEAPAPKVVDATKESSAKAISTEKQTSPKVNDVAKVEKTSTISENWHKKDVVDPEKKGMFKGKTKEELHKEKTAAKKAGDTTKEKEVNFALRAKNNWGKANEGAEISVDTAKTNEGKEISVDTTKVNEYGDEHPISVKDAVKENFGEKESPISSDEPVMPAGEDGAVASAAPSDATAGAEGSAEPELDAAAAALDSMGAGAEESPETGGIEGMEGAEGAVKDIEKYVGKATQKIRTTELTPEMALGFLKSFITAFEGKLSELEHEDRKELASLIMNDEASSEEGGEEGLGGGEKPSFGAEKSAGEKESGIPTDSEEESDIEEAINQHLAEMGIGEDENVEGHENIAAATKPFKKYVAERGYNPEKVEEISLMEMVGLMNSYTNECGEAPDAAGMSDYVTNEVHEKMNESGNSLFEDLMKPFGEKIKANKKAYAAEAVIAEHFGVEDGDEEEEGSEEVAGDENEPQNSISVGEEPAGEEDGAVEEPVEVEKEISIAPAGDTLAVGVPGAAKTGEGSKSATVDLNAATITLTMNEAEQKLRKIVQKKLADKIAGKKVTLNEAKQTALSAMIDEAINEALVKRRAAIEKRLLKK
jgi:hypothetical protein